MAAQHNPAVDLYIDQAQPFAIPILVRLRKLVHQGCPGICETIKWGHPFFEHQGVILGHMMAFQQHCRFGFWATEMSAAGKGESSLQRITSIKDLPAAEEFLERVRQAAELIDRGTYTSPIAARKKKDRPAKAEFETPPELEAALLKHPQAASTFAAFTPSCRREYSEWIAGAKRPETRAKRVQQAVAWIEEGKQRNWKHQPGAPL